MFDHQRANRCAQCLALVGEPPISGRNRRISEHLVGLTRRRRGGPSGAPELIAQLIALLLEKPNNCSVGLDVPGQFGEASQQG